MQIKLLSFSDKDFEGNLKDYLEFDSSNNEQIMDVAKNILLEMDEQRKLHETFLSISVCTALTRHEEKLCIKKGLSKKHPEFENGKIITNSLTGIHPFKRYDFSNGLKIYEVISGREICPKSFTLRDHINLMAEADIYNWDTILSWSKTK